MEKITKKKKKSRRLRRRIGLIAIGGMSLVLTVCLSVGATLAWFAGSTWAGNDLYMGGPVYVEMAGRGAAAGTAGNGNATANWVGGDGKLDIIASARNTGTAKGTAGASGNTINNYYSGGSGTTNNKYDTSNVLLPGQKLLIYSQARVYSTAYADNLNDGNYTNQSSGANTTNISNGTTTYTSSKGVKKTTTTSVLRAKFSINVEFDPTVGFNNFNDPSYAEGYPVQSADYKGDAIASGSSATFHTALGASGISGSYLDYSGRRDAVGNTVVNSSYTASCTVAEVKGSINKWAIANSSTTANNVELWAIKEGKSTSIYKWKYVSEKVYNAAAKKVASGLTYSVTTDGVTNTYVPMNAPFNGEYNTLGGYSANKSGGTGNGYYGVWVMDSTGTKHIESDSFYKARCTAYIQSYKAHYEDEYDRRLILSIGSQITQLEDALNNAFVKLVNQSSDKILDGMVKGYTANDKGEIQYVSGGSKTAATWLYVDSTIGQDTNASDSSTNVGGWWYLVESDSTNKVSTGKNEVKTVVDNVVVPNGTSAVTSTSESTGITSYNWAGNVNGAYNAPSSASYTIVRAKGAAGSGYTTTKAQAIADTDTRILNAKLFEITPDASNGVLESVGRNTGTYKVVSVSFPFVNGNFELPGKELTNIFANAKISFQITFQALQAFFPFTPSIDGCEAGSALAGTGKALNITNAIPIFNEAFDYLSFLSE